MQVIYEYIFQIISHWKPKKIIQIFFMSIFILFCLHVSFKLYVCVFCFFIRQYCIFMHLCIVKCCQQFLNHIRLFLSTNYPPTHLQLPSNFVCFSNLVYQCFFFVCFMFFVFLRLRTAIHFLVLRRFAVVVGKFYLLGSSGGQSG